MDYQKAIIEMIQRIDDKALLIKVYAFLKAWLEG